MSELSPNTTCPLCQGDVGSGDIVSIGEKGANSINKACVERGDDIHLTAGTGVHKSASRKPWPAGQIWPADLIQLARVGMLSTLIFLVMSTKYPVSFIDITQSVMLRSINFTID